MLRVARSRPLSPTLALLGNNMASRYGNGVTTGPTTNSGHYTLTALNRWSVAGSQLPAVDAIKSIHVYDFDNTLFKTPLPNPKLWHQATLGKLASPDVFANGGWWHDSRILAATGEGADTEEARAWKGWWNDQIVELVQLSMAQKEALCILLTGRGERRFTDLLKRMVKSKGLEFDMMGLKPEVGPNNEHFKSTLTFKTAFLTQIMETYCNAEEIRIYEDRPKQVTGFQDFLAEYNQSKSGARSLPSRPPIDAKVILVADTSGALDPVVEVAEIQTLINEHNALLDQGKKKPGGRNERLELKKNIFLTGYMIKPDDAAKLAEMVQLPDGDFKFHSNAVLITSRLCPPHILDKVGGKGAKVKWGVAKTGSSPDGNIWAVQVNPIPANTPYHTDSPTPTVVIATRKNARPSDTHRIHKWQSVSPDKAFSFDTEVGEKYLLRIEPENPAYDNNNNDNSSAPAGNRNKRKFGATDEDYQQRSNAGNSRGGHHNNNNYQGGRGGNNPRGGGSRGGGGSQTRGYRGAARGRGGGGRGGRGGYRSLDDVGTRDGSGNFGANSVSYDDNFPPFNANSSQQSSGPPLNPFQNAVPPPPPAYGGQQPFQQPQNGQWQAPNNNNPNGGGFNPNNGNGVDLQKFY
ncbi:hypothetical protein F5Y16DRAFT_414108 [Xylariaceae sp. FL0255]|nr:hypothetical protein F5Y16DRAFT_414108 [Xylariaceae sp. FL0255]